MADLILIPVLFTNLIIKQDEPNFHICLKAHTNYLENKQAAATPS